MPTRTIEGYEKIINNYDEFIERLKEGISEETELINHLKDKGSEKE